VRAGVVAHGVVLGVLLLFLGLIHVAPLGATPKGAAAERSYVHVDAQPWAKITIDGTVVGYTPQMKAIEILVGRHTLRLEHDWYQPYIQTLDVVRSTPETAPLIQFDFETRGTLKPGMKKPQPEAP
jgi:hypothetical protein